MVIDLRSDTVTKPCKGMLDAMLSAKLGDDVFGEDPSILELESKAALLFGHEMAMFCPSGTMANQIAIKVQTEPLNEVICHKLSHIYNYEVGGYAFHSGVTLKLLEGNRGLMDAEDINQNVNPNYDWLPVTRLVCIEDTCNKGGGSYYQLSQIQLIRNTCFQNNLKLHLDGARIFNALTETGNTTKEIGKFVDSLTFCISKGLGCPIGSILVGNNNFIKRARRVRKVMGGGMRQAGILAAAGIYALEHNIPLLKKDHIRAKAIESVLYKLSWVKNVQPVDTNIILFEIEDHLNSEKIVQKLAENKIKCMATSQKQIRFVTHLDFTDEMLSETINILQKIVIN